MLVTARTPKDLVMFLDFFKKSGVELTLANDLRVLGRTNCDHEIIGAVAYTAFNGRTCSMHTAGNGNWVSRKFIAAAFEYPFVTNNLVQVFGPVPANNERALRFNRHMGFDVLTRIRGGWDEKVDLIIMGMHKSQCRWLSKEMFREKVA